VLYLRVVTLFGCSNFKLKSRMPGNNVGIKGVARGWAQGVDESLLFV